MSTVDRYPKQVFWSDEDEGYIAVAPDLPGSSAFGESEQEALAELDNVIPAWIAAARKAGNPVPPPSRPAVESYSGRFALRLPKSLHRQLAINAKADGVSLNQHIVNLLNATSAVRSVEEAARISASQFLDAIRSTRMLTIASWQNQAHARSKAEEFAYVSPQNWSHLTEEQQQISFSQPCWPIEARER